MGNALIRLENIHKTYKTKDRTLHALSGIDLQIEKGKIRDVDARVLAVMCFGITFQSLVLWKVYDGSSSIDTEDYSQKFLDMLYHGIKP